MAGEGDVTSQCEEEKVVLSSGMERGGGDEDEKLKIRHVDACIT